MYVSRGGIKLEQALNEFNIDVKDKVCLDIGASTGGFTDCLLQHGAARVYAVDVAYGILAWKLRQDPRVVVVERTNARYLTLKNLKLQTCLPMPTGRQAAGTASNIQLCVIDVSFISLSKVLPAVHDLLTDKAEVIALIKPQFEAKREQVPRGGVITDEKVRQEVIEKVKTEAEAIGFKVKNVIESPITGNKGNIEFLAHLQKLSD